MSRKQVPRESNHHRVWLLPVEADGVRVVGPTIVWNDEEVEDRDVVVVVVVVSDVVNEAENDVVDDDGNAVPAPVERLGPLSRRRPLGVGVEEDGLVDVEDGGVRDPEEGWRDSARTPRRSPPMPWFSSW